MGLISCSADAELKNGFTMPFKESADYLGMHYLGDIHAWMENDNISETSKELLHEFIEKNIR